MGRRDSSPTKYGPYPYTYGSFCHTVQIKYAYEDIKGIKNSLSAPCLKRKEKKEERVKDEEKKEKYGIRT